METEKYLCEFFFTDFVHYLLLLLLVAVARGYKIVEIIKDKKED